MRQMADFILIGRFDFYGSETRFAEELWIRYDSNCFEMWISVDHGLSNSLEMCSRSPASAETKVMKRKAIARVHCGGTRTWN
jgi:hypothetical protein